MSDPESPDDGDSRGGAGSPARDRPSVLAHRGFAGAAPENTVDAARRAATGPDRAAMVEVDAMPTADGTVVCFHDAHLHAEGASRGVTDARGTVWETPDEVVLDAEVLDSGQTVPRLADVLGALPAEVGVNVELKNPGSDAVAFAESLDPDELAARRERWESFVTDVLAVLDDHDNDVLISSFYEAAVAATRDAAPSIPVAVLAWDSLDDALAVAARYDAEAVHPPWNLVAGTPFAGKAGHLDAPPDVTTDVVARAHEAGRAVNVWTVTTWYQAEQLRRAGVDGLLADYPRLLAGDRARDSDSTD